MDYRELFKVIVISFTSVPMVLLVLNYEFLQHPISMSVSGLLAMFFIACLLILSVPNDLVSLEMPDVLLPRPSMSRTKEKKRSASRKEENLSFLKRLTVFLLARFLGILARKPSQRLTTSSTSILRKPELPAAFRGLIYYLISFSMWCSIAGMVTLFYGCHPENNTYCQNGEMYLTTSFARVAVVWNGTIHYFLSLRILYALENRRKCRNAALYWCGSVFASQIVFLCGALIGPQSNQLKPCFILSLAFTLVPISVLYLTLNTPRKRALGIDVPTDDKYILPSLYGLLVIISALISLIRLGAVLQSKTILCQTYVQIYEPHMLEPSRFGFVWILISAIYSVPFQVVALFALFIPGYQWVIDGSIFYAGAMMQGTAVYILHTEFFDKNTQFNFSSNGSNKFLVVNLLLVGTAHLLMNHCKKNSHFFMYRRLSKKSYELVRERLKGKKSEN